MRKLLALLALLPGFAVATPVTYEFTGALASAIPIEYARGYITFDTDALLDYETKRYNYDGLESSHSVGYNNLITSMWMSFGDDEIYASGGIGTGGTITDRSGSSAAIGADWYFAANTQAIDGRYFRFNFEGRCYVYEDCPNYLDELFLNSDLLKFDVTRSIYATFRVEDSLFSEFDLSTLYYFTSFNRVEVPEPGTLGLFGLGLLGVALARRRIRKP